MDTASIRDSLLIEEEAAGQNGGIGGSSCGASSSVTAVVVFSTAVVVCASFTFGCAAGYSSPAESGIRDDLGLSVAEYSVFGSILTVGGIIGSAASGKITDVMGRRRALWFSDVFFTVGWLAIAFAKDYWWLDLGRLSIGFGIGIICYAVPVYITEITPKDIRGGFASAGTLMLCCGFSLTFFVGTIVSWRSLALIGVIPCILQVIGLFFIPESPRWLAKIGREDEFETTLQRLRGVKTDISQEAAEIKD